MTSFVSDDNLCGGTLLGLVGRGHSIVADIRNLSEKVPPAFLHAANQSADSKTGGKEKSKDKSKDKAKDKSTPPPENPGGLLGFFSSSQTTPGSRGASRSQSASYPTFLGGRNGEQTTSDLGTDDGERYQSFLFDFSYLRNPEECEASISPAEKSPSDGATDAVDGGGEESIDELEAEFAVTHRVLLSKFYRLFESIYLYQADLNKFADDLAKGYYIQYTVESVLLDTVGRQLLCEAVYMYGMMLILMERHIPGPVRERLIIAFFRFCAKDGNLSRIDEICKLCKTVGTNSAPESNLNKAPMDEDKLFSRFPLPVELVRNVVGCLISDDIYLQSSSFPNFDHRSTRLSTQAAMLYVILFFDPNVLKDEPGKMREIVDKFFQDNWVIPLYMGLTADLSEEWERFSAAKSALDNVLKEGNVKRLHISNAKLIGQCMAELRAYLTMGILTDHFVLDNKKDLLDCMRRCNVAIRWRILHRRTVSKAYSDIICKTTNHITPDPKLEGDFAVHDTHVVSLILLSSQLELQLKTIFARLLETKGDIWVDCRTRAKGMMVELSNYFKGDQALARVTRNEGLMKWFAGMAEEIESLSYEHEEHFTVTGRKIQLCVQALEDIEQFDLVDRDIQVKAFLKDTTALLLQMARAVSIKKDICTAINWISDMTYATEAITSYVPIIHTRVTKDPSNVSLLQGFFLKLSSSLAGPVQRLEQSKSCDVAKVAEYYSSQLVAFVRNVLEVIPTSVFEILIQIVDIKERRLVQPPAKIEHDSLRAYAQLGERYKLAMLTHELSVFTDGMLAMENTIIGEIEINPRRLLEGGLRKELVRQVSELLDDSLQFDFPTDTETTASLLKYQVASLRSLSSLASRMEGFRGAIEYIQDFVDIDGLKIWVEELSRIIGYNVEQEVNKYLLKKVLDFESKYQSLVAPIPQFPRAIHEASCVNFMGRTISSLLKVTDSQSTIFSRECSGWYLADGTEVCGIKTISLLRRAIGVCGLSGLDKLLSYRILHELHRFVKFYRTTVKKSAVLLEQIRDGLFPEWKTPEDAIRLYATASKKLEMLMMPMLTCFRRVGQAQLLRKMIRNELRSSARVDAHILQQSLSALNTALLNEMKSQRPEDTGGKDLEHIFGLLHATGEGDPMLTVFMTTDPLEGLPVLLAFFAITYISKFTYDPDFGSLVRAKEGYPIDGWPVIAGMATLLKQFHPSYAKSVLAYLAQFVQVSMQNYAVRKQSKKEDTTRLVSDLKHTILFTSQLCSISNIPRSAMHEFIPQYMMEMCADL